MKKFALLVGNGFTLDLVLPLGLHSSYPLQNFKSRDINYDTFLDKIPAVKNELFGGKDNDFSTIRKYISRNQNNLDKECQLRRFLSLSYSMFQEIVDSHEAHLMNWKWVHWLKENKEGLNCAISLNYDLNLENALRLAGISYKRTGTNELDGKVYVLKPHGSIDFDLASSVASFGSVEQRWRLITKLNDGGSVHIVPQSERLWPRIEADIVPPSMHNFQRNLRWVNAMFTRYTMQVNELEALVIVGSSYWNVDRPEIDFFLKKLNKQTTVFIIDPRPNGFLINRIKSLGLPLGEPTAEGLPW